MYELQTMMAELLKLAKSNPDLLFKITPDESYTGWGVEFTKGGWWWETVADSPDEPLESIIKDALVYFDSIADDDIQKQVEAGNEESIQEKTSASDHRG